jgi:CheY-like chemotaxis protein
LNRKDPALAGRKVLIVDDDVRNIFALTSALEAYNMKVVHAENGQEGIDLLKATPGIEAVLMDIMMPEMDGYEAITAIRDMAEFKKLPIIALTAKAMKADRDHCLQVGASDYISKPLDMDQLISLLRVWLYRQDESR